MAAHLLSCSMVKRAVVTTSVAWEGWSLPSVTAGTSVGTRGCWGGQAPAPTALLQSVPGASSTAAAPWQAPAMGNVAPRASPTCGRTPG